MVKNNHEPIVDEMIFNLVQQMLQRDTRKSPQEELVQPLSGIVFCADCMRSMCRRVVKKGLNSFYYYVCSTNKRTRECSSHSISQNTLESIVYRAIQKQIELVVEMDKLLSEIKHSGFFATKIMHLDALVEEKKTEIEHYQGFRMKLLEAFHESVIDREEYDLMRQKYTAMISQVQISIEKIIEERNSILNEGAGNYKWAEQFTKYQGDQELTREMVVTLIDKIYIYEDKRVKIDFNYRNEIAYYQQLLEEMKRVVS